MLKIKIVLSALALSLCAGLSACGDNPPDSTSTTGTEPAPVDTTAPATTEDNGGKSENWGQSTVYVPEGFHLKGGSIMDPADSLSFSVKQSEFVFFDFEIQKSENDMVTKDTYNRTIYTTGQKNVEDTFNGIKWTGFQYDAYSSPAFFVHAQVNTKYVCVSSTGFTFDQDTVKEVLGSLEVILTEEDKTEKITTEVELPDVVLPTYQTTTLSYAKIGVPEGYAVVVDEAPKHLRLKNETTEETIDYFSAEGKAADIVKDELMQMDGNIKGMKKWDVFGVRWFGYKPSDGHYVLAANGNGGYVRVEFSNAEIQEIESLLFCVQLITE